MKTFYADPTISIAAPSDWSPVESTEEAFAVFLCTPSETWLQAHYQQAPLKPVIGPHKCTWTPWQLGKDNDTTVIWDRLDSAWQRYQKLPPAVIESQSPLQLLIATIYLLGEQLAVQYSSQYAKGYCYGIESQFPNAISMLAALEEEGHLSAQISNRSHPCPHCHNIAVLLSDACTQCMSPRFTQEPVLHHFACGLQSIESDFVTDTGDKECPKCHQSMKQIGIDFDQPMNFVQCNDCGHSDQDTVISGLCLQCEHQFLLTDTHEYNINDYRLTTSGLNALLEGTLAVTDISAVLSQTLPLVTFKTLSVLIDKYQALAQRQLLHTVVMRLTLPTHTLPLDNEAIEFMKALGEQVAAIIRPTDSVCYHQGELTLLLVGTSPQMGQRIKRRLFAQLNQGFRKSLLDQINCSHQTLTSFISAL